MPPEPTTTAPPTPGRLTTSAHAAGDSGRAWEEWEALLTQLGISEQWQISKNGKLQRSERRG